MNTAEQDFLKRLETIIESGPLDSTQIAGLAMEAFLDISDYSNVEYDEFIGKLIAMGEGDEFRLTKVQILSEIKEIKSKQLGKEDYT